MGPVSIGVEVQQNIDGNTPSKGVNAQLLLMLVTTHHTKHMLNYECLTSARIMHIFESVLA